MNRLARSIGCTEGQLWTLLLAAVLGGLLLFSAIRALG